MDYATQGSLADRSKRQLSLHVATVERVFRQLFEAVEYMHSKGCVHRDLKLGNVLVRSLDPVHILVPDFHFVKWNAPLKHALGTMEYTAPEIAQAHHHPHLRSSVHTANSDVWSLGVMLLNCCIVGGIEKLRSWPSRATDRPGAIEEWVSFVRAHLDNEETALISENFVALHQVSRRMLQVNPEDRPPVSLAKLWLQDTMAARCTRT